VLFLCGSSLLGIAFTLFWFLSLPKDMSKAHHTSCVLVPGHQKNEIEGDLQMKPNENSLCLPSDRVLGSMLRPYQQSDWRGG
jgi:hypothetical protein